MFSMPSKSLLILIMTIAFNLTVLKAEGNIWNRIVSLQSHFDRPDYAFSSSEPGNSDVYRGPFDLELYSDHTFTFKIDYDGISVPYIIHGKTTLSNKQSFYGNTYILTSNDLKGNVSYQINLGLKWVYNLQSSALGFKLQREQLRYTYANWVILVCFGLAGMLVFPLCQRTLKKVLYNIQKRTHVFLELLILTKMQWVLACLLINCYFSITNLEWYFIIPIYTIYLFALTPLLIHFLFFLGSLQKHLKQYEWFQKLGATIKFLIMALAIISTPLILLISIFFSKGIILYFFLTPINIYQYVFACRQKRYSFGKVILYDVILTAVLTSLGLLLPSLNFMPLTFKDVLIFWNYYIAIFVFGIILTRKVIKLQIVEETKPDQFPDIQRFSIGDEMGQELPKMTTNENFSA